MPFAIIESVPDLLGWRPLPYNLGLWCFLTPAANLGHSSVFLNETKAFFLGANNVFVFGVNLFLGLSVMFLVRALDGFLELVFVNFNKGFFIDSVHVSAGLLHLGGFLEELLVNNFFS